jgi:hypothetical protein
MTRLSAIIVLLIGLLNFSQAAHAANGPVKLIHYGWENPAISKLPGIVEKLAQSPFDGLAAKASRHNEIFQSKPYPEADFADDFKTLATLPEGAMSGSYLMINSATDGSYDWTNEEHWQAALANMRVVVRLARDGGFKGIVFDVEPYGKNPWDYSTQPDPPSAKRPDFEAYAKLMNARGAAMMNMMEAEFPGLEVWCLFGLSANNATLEKLRGGEAKAEVFSKDSYGLWPAFFSGWIEASDEATRIIDGNESAYYYTSRKDFDAARSYIQKDFQEVLDPPYREKYGRKIELGHAVYLDGIMASAQSPRFIGYYLKSDEERRDMLRAHVMNAMQTSQSLVWVYAELPKWWDEAPDKTIDETLRAAKLDALSGRPAPGDLPPVAAAAKALSEAISIGGTILDESGNPVPIDGFEPALAKVACGNWGDHGEYGCTFPRGVDIVIEPVIKGRTFKPARIERKAPDKAEWGANFVVK